MTNLPGTLEWAPAAEHLDLVAPPTADAIRALGMEIYVAPIDATLADTAEFCAHYGVALSESANCVIVEGRRGEATTLAALHVLATDRADVNKAVRKHLDVRKISFAPMDVATQETGMEYGGICAVGVPAGWPILIDRAVADAEWLVIGSGLRSSKLAIRGHDLGSLPGAQILALAQQG